METFAATRIYIILESKLVYKHFKSLEALLISIALKAIKLEPNKSRSYY